MIVSIIEVFLIYKVLEERSVYLSMYEYNFILTIIFLLNMSLTSFFSYDIISYLILPIARSGNYISYGTIYVLPIIFIVSITDIKNRDVYDIDVICGFIIVTLCLLLRGGYEVFIYSFLGGAVLFSITFLISAISGGMGMGDVTFYFLAGSLVGLKYCMVLFFLSFFIGFLYIVGVKVLGGEVRDGGLAFTPFISISIILINLINLIIMFDIGSICGIIYK